MKGSAEKGTVRAPVDKVAVKAPALKGLVGGDSDWYSKIDAATETVKASAETQSAKKAAQKAAKEAVRKARNGAVVQKGASTP